MVQQEKIKSCGIKRGGEMFKVDDIVTYMVIDKEFRESLHYNSYSIPQ